MSDLSNSAADLSQTESNLGQALVLLHRVASRLDDPAKRAEVQTAFRQAAGFLEAARQAHEGGGSPAPLGLQKVSTGVDAVTAAVIAAAVAVHLDQPYRLVSVQQVSAPVAPHLNVWAVEGRTQIFMSHRVR